ncbi:hypothetical protein [Acetobacter sp.]
MLYPIFLRDIRTDRSIPVNTAISVRFWLGQQPSPRFSPQLS